MGTTNVYKPGERVKTSDPSDKDAYKGIKAHVVSVIIREGWHVQYKIAWWSDGARHTATVESSEVQSYTYGSGKSTKTVDIGFEIDAEHGEG